MTEYLSQLWAWLSAYNILEIAGAFIVVTTLLEKGFNVEFVGRRLFRLIGRIFGFFFGWFLTPFKPAIASVKEFIHHSERLEKRFLEITENDQLREQKRDEQFTEQNKILVHVEKSITTIKNEVTLNGGKSMKDAVIRLVKHDAEKWEMMQEIREHMRLTSLRLDIADEADKRMTFRLDGKGDCVQISAMFLRFFGYTEKDMLGSDWEFCIAKQSMDEVQKKWKRSIARREHYRNDQFIIDSDGKEHYCRVEGHPMVVDDELLYFHGTVIVLDADTVKAA